MGDQRAIRTSSGEQSANRGGRRKPRSTAPAAIAVAASITRTEWVPRGSAAPIAAAQPTTIASDAAPPPPRNPNPRSLQHHHRRSHHHPSPSSNPPATSQADSKAISPASGEGVPQLVQEIQDKLARGAVECMICYDMVRRSAPIWSCSSCFSIFHLPCIRKWARSPTSVADPSADHWRCPGCQSIQSVHPNELSYICFCGSRPDPPNDLYLTPHSCGEPCGKPLGHDNSSFEDLGIEPCPHVCVLQCHPGPCPPCKAFAPRRPCPCGKKTIVRRCSDGKSPPTCGLVCDRVLACGRHRCENLCHTGSCARCAELITVTCFCKRKVEAILCSDVPLKGELQEGVGIFSCDEVCGRRLSCGNHMCRERCHAGPCGGCDLSPEKIKSCHCGKMALVGQRWSCLDPIPCCSMVCDKLLPCGVHRCSEMCHEGDCSPCLVRVEQKCRCRSSTRMIECYKIIQDNGGFACEKLCGKKKGCGRHRCSERCCPLSRAGSTLSDGDWDPHLCSIPCGKRLQCGQHSCQLLCHNGHCPPCLETIFTDLSCACGRTTIPPPLPCGTAVPTCQHPCTVPQSCGHPAVHTCHFGDCPPCSMTVAKECVGGHVLLRNVPCGSRDIRCNQLCGQTRQCGIHACARTCHPPPCDTSSSCSGSVVRSSCGQLCCAPRRDCKHNCSAPCHPSLPCPDVRCDFQVTISCSCGRLSANVPCGTGGSTSALNTDAVFEASIIQKLPASLQPIEANGKKVPLGQRKLVCNDECLKMERKRVLADAFDITPTNLEALHLGHNSTASELITELFRREPKWVLAVEERFKFMVLGKSKGSTHKVHVFCHMTKEKRDAVRQMAERWKLSVQAAGWEPRRFLVVHVTLKSKPPVGFVSTKLGFSSSVPHYYPPAFDPLIDMDPRLVVSMLDLPGDADISALVLRFGGECELVWLNDKNALAVFSDPARAATALRRLDNGSVYSGAVVVLRNGNGSGGGGGAAGHSGNTVVKMSNPWKKAIAPNSDLWGGDLTAAGVDALAPMRRGPEAPSLSETNPWNILESETMLRNGGNMEREIDSGGDREKGEFYSDVQVGGVHGEMIEEALDDWEEVFEC